MNFNSQPASATYKKRLSQVKVKKLPSTYQISPNFQKLFQLLHLCYKIRRNNKIPVVHFDSDQQTSPNKIKNIQTKAEFGLNKIYENDDYFRSSQSRESPISNYPNSEKGKLSSMSQKKPDNHFQNTVAVIKPKIGTKKIIEESSLRSSGISKSEASRQRSLTGKYSNHNQDLPGRINRYIKEDKKAAIKSEGSQNYDMATYQKEKTMGPESTPELLNVRKDNIPPVEIKILTKDEQYDEVLKK